MDYGGLVNTVKDVIKNSELGAIKKYFKENRIESETFHNFNEILFYAIKENISVEKVQFILERRHHKNLNILNNKNETPLLLAIEENNFEMADLFLENKADINFMVKNYETIDYLFKHQLLNTRNLRYLLMKGFSEKNITSGLIEKLIVTKNNEFLEIIFVHYNRFSNTFLIDRFLLLYKNRTPLSSQALERLIPRENNKLEVTEAMYKMANSCKNWEVFRILFENDGSSDSVKWNRIVKYHLLEGSVKSNNCSFVRKVIRYVIDITGTVTMKEEDVKPREAFPPNDYGRGDVRSDDQLLRIIFCHRINELTNLENYPFLEAVKQNNLEMVKMLLRYADRYDILININERDDWWGNYPLLEAIKQNNEAIVRCLVDYDARVMTRNGTPKIKVVALKNYPLLEAVKYNNKECVDQLFRYATCHRVTLDVNERNALGHSPLQMAVQHNNLALVKLLMAYADEHEMAIPLNDIALHAVKQNNVKMMNLLMDYANAHGLHLHLHLNFNDHYQQDKENSYLLEALEQDNLDMVKLLMNYAQNHNIPLKINEPNYHGHFALLEAIRHNHTEMVKVLMAYANEHQLPLDINQKDGRGNYPLLKAIQQNNREILQLLLDYSDLHHLPLQVNDRFGRGEDDQEETTPVLEAIRHNNPEILKLLIDYAQSHSLSLMIIQETSNEKKYSPLLEAIDQKNSDLLKLLLEYAQRNHIDLQLNRYPWGNPLNPFYRATSHHQPDLIKLLIDYAKTMTTATATDDVQIPIVFESDHDGNGDGKGKKEEEKKKEMMKMVQELQPYFSR